MTDNTVTALVLLSPGLRYRRNKIDSVQNSRDLDGHVPAHKPRPDYEIKLVLCKHRVVCTHVMGVKPFEGRVTKL